MIDKVIKTVANELANYLDRVAGLENPASEKIDVSHLFNASGEAIPTHLGITLVNIEEERVNRANDAYAKKVEGYVKINPPISLNLYLLFTANFQESYDEALKFIAYVIQFFQAKSVFNKENTPALSDKVEKLVVELQPLSFEQQNYLWGMVGGKYLPSALYKFRLIVIQEEILIETIGEVKIIKEDYKLT